MQLPTFATLNTHPVAFSDDAKLSADTKHTACRVCSGTAHAQVMQLTRRPGIRQGCSIVTVGCDQVLSLWLALRVIVAALAPTQQWQQSLNISYWAASRAA